MFTSKQRKTKLQNEATQNAQQIYGLIEHINIKLVAIKYAIITY